MVRGEVQSPARSARPALPDRLKVMTYHRLAAVHRRRRHVLGGVVIVAVWLVVGTIAYALTEAAPLGARARLAADFVVVALLLPATWLGLRLRRGRRRPALWT